MRVFAKHLAEHERLDDVGARQLDGDQVRDDMADRLPAAPRKTPQVSPAGHHLAGVLVAEPLILDTKDEMEAYIEIVESRENVITAIELLSPSNKESEASRTQWRRKRKDYLRSGISLVELDLVRGGWVLPGREKLPKPLPTNRVTHGACITRYYRREYREFYDLPLREPLPVLGIPLRERDTDAVLDLQALVNQCYLRGRYAESIDYDRAPKPPLPKDELEWAMALVKQA